MRAIAALLLSSLAALSSAPALAAPPEALPADAQQTLRSIRHDPRPRQIIKGTHYWISNEGHHEYWYETLKDRGGAYVGVGSEQNYTLAGWARSEVIILMDFDQAIADLHEAFGVAFRHAETPDAFYALWKEKDAAQLKALITAHFKDDATQRERTLKAVDRAHRLVRYRFAELRRVYPKHKLPHYLTDADTYAHLRALWRGGRVVVRRGDLLADRTMLDASKALGELKVPVRVLYTSNAEQYFDYTPAFRRNIVALPGDDRSWVIRTHPRKLLKLAPRDGFHYNRQTLDNFKAWITKYPTRDSVELIQYRRTNLPEPGSSVIEKPAKVSKKRVEVAPMPAPASR